MPNFQALWILTTVEAPNSRTSSVSHDAEWQLQIVLNSQKTSLGKSSYCRRNGCILKLVFKHLFILQLFLITWSETAPQQLQIVLHIENDPTIPIENSIMPRIIMASVIIISELKRWCPSCKNAVKKPYQIMTTPPNTVEVMVKPMNVPAWKKIIYQISEVIADKLSDI